MGPSSAVEGVSKRKAVNVAIQIQYVVIEAFVHKVYVPLFGSQVAS